MGDDAGVDAFIGGSTELIDLDGQMMLPGFFDCHVHLTSGGVQELECNLAGTRGRDEVLAAVRSYIETEEPSADGWIRGSGWDIGHITHPEKEWLDSIEPDRPIYLNCMDGHSAWVNSKALELAGITDTTPDPLHGEIYRNPATGEATGWLQGYATSLVKKVMPELRLEDRTAGLEAGIRLAHQSR